MHESRRHLPLRRLFVLCRVWMRARQRGTVAVESGESSNSPFHYADIHFPMRLFFRTQMTHKNALEERLLRLSVRCRCRRIVTSDGSS